MKDIIKRAEQGERIVVVYPSYRGARWAFAQVPEGCKAYANSLQWQFHSMGVIRFMSVQTDPDKMRGLDSDVLFMDGAEYDASPRLLDIADERASMYRQRHKV
jgi:hypothetical protein